MTRAGLQSTAARLGGAALAAGALAFAAPWSSGDAPPEDAPGVKLRPASGLIGPLPRQRGCEQTAYEGPTTALYSDRPYHTSGAVAELIGRVFCRGKRHGQALWILDVTRATTLYTLASEGHALEVGGWRRLATPVRVDAAGLVLDRLYARPIEPGRYAIQHGHTTTANPIFFSPEDARVTAIPAQGDG